MKFKKRKKRKKSFGTYFPHPDFSISEETKQSLWVLVLLVLALALFLSVLGQAGEVGDIINILMFKFFGTGSWGLPVFIFFSALFLAKSENKNFDSSNIFGLFLFVASLCSLLYYFDIEQGGGLLGGSITPWLLPFFGAWLLAVLLSAALFVSLLLAFDANIGDLVGEESIFFKTTLLVFALLASPFLVNKTEEDINHEEDEEPADKNKKALVKEYEIDEDEEEADDALDEKGSGADKIIDTESSSFSNSHKETADKDLVWPKNNIKIDIPVKLLKGRPSRPTSGNIERNQGIIKKTLRDFGVPVSMGEVRVGPSVTQYTFKPSEGIPVSKVKALADDLALNLALHPVRIEAPIPGKPLVGLEVPNQTKVLVTLKEIIRSKKFKSSTSGTMIALGRDVGGDIRIDDLAKMPHLLVAGATGSGKSICLHTIIASLLYQNDPDDLKFVLIDPKQVEFSLYNGLPYLMAPVVTDSKRAVRALQWCLGEMERRLAFLSRSGFQDLSDYNKGRKKRYCIPKLVIVVDELGDLLSTARKEAEAAIIRLGQKARAAGIHLVLATQRPTVDILSGLIKANIPGRIAFSTTSAMNSKTILEFTGAENLLGKGDLLFINSTLSKPLRLQGAYVSKEEIRSMVAYAKRQAGNIHYEEDITAKQNMTLGQEEREEFDDDLLEDAEKLIYETGKASAASLQSRLAIGYPRANRILDILEKRGIVGPSIQNKPREILV